MNVAAFLSVETLPPPACAEGDAGQFSRIVLPHLKDAHALARWLTGSVTDAQDVVQEASIRALLGIGTYANGNARAWLLTIVRNTACDWLRKNRPAVLVFVDRLEDVEGGRAADLDGTTPETALVRHDAERWLAAAISALPAPLRETLLLRDVQGLSYRNIADLQSISIGTVMSRLFRARRQLIGLAASNLQETGSCS